MAKLACLKDVVDRYGLSDEWVAAFSDSNTRLGILESFKISNDASKQVVEEYTAVMAAFNVSCRAFAVTHVERAHVGFYHVDEELRAIYGLTPVTSKELAIWLVYWGVAAFGASMKTSEFIRTLKSAACFHAIPEEAMQRVLSYTGYCK